MTLVRQVWLLLIATMLLALAGGVGVAVQSALATLKTQVQIKNSDNAAALAQVLSQQRGDAMSMEILLGAQFDTGFYREIRLVGTDDRPLFERAAAIRPSSAPDWFVRALPIAVEPGVAQVSDGWRPIGTLQVSTQITYAHDDLWRAALRATAVLGVIGFVAGLLATAVVNRIASALDGSVAQAKALLDGSFVTVPEPRIPELRRLTRAMNAMVARLKLVFEAQSEQVEAMRRRATCDALTGLANREHFLAQMSTALQRHDGALQVGLVLLRLGDLGELNNQVGRAQTDRLLKAVADTLHDYGEKVRGSLIGRLNGSDFALCLPAGGVGRESGLAIAQALQVVVPSLAPAVRLAVGVVEVDRETASADLSRLLGIADAALAQAESQDPYSVHVVELGDPAWLSVAPLGEGAWRSHIASALDDPARAQLATFPVINQSLELAHLECPMRLRLEEGGRFETAAFWLPLALCARATIARDGIARSVNLSHASLPDAGFAARLRALLQASPRAARGLWLDVPELAAVEHFARLQQIGRELRPLGARIGLEHAGHRLREVQALYEAGLDYVKLDAALIAHVAADTERAYFIKGLVAMLHGLAIEVLAEGVQSADDAEVLWRCGVDAITGPWASRQVPIG
jgi:diguanylate cyclase (GGDEF)-like protein